MIIIYVAYYGIIYLSSQCVYMYEMNNNFAGCTSMPMPMMLMMMEKLKFCSVSFCDK